MGSYLRFYLKDKEEKMHDFASFRTSSSEIYSTIRDVCNIESLEAYNKETHTCELSKNYTLITTGILSECIDDLKKGIDSWKDRITTYYKISGKYNIEDAAHEIYTDEVFLREQQDLLAQFELLYKIVSDIEEKYTDFEGLYAQVG